MQFIAGFSLQTALEVENIFLIKLNVKTSSRKLKQISCEKHQHKTDLLTPNSLQTTFLQAQP
jgi:hypothetical protein